MPTFADTVQEIIKSIGEVEGTSVQTYSEPRVQAALEQMFGICFRKLWWPQYTKWFQRTLDGTNGVLTTNIGPDIKEFRDIRVIIPDGKDKGLPQLPFGRNPFNLTGTTPLYYESLDTTHASYGTRILQFWPKTATGDVFIHARLMPTLIDSTELYLDQKMLINGTAWIILEDEDINPNAAQLRKDLFEENFSAILKEFAEQAIENPGVNTDRRFVEEWQI